MFNSSPEEISRDTWLTAAWKQEWETAGPSRIHGHIWDPGADAVGRDDLQWWQRTIQQPTNRGRLMDSAECEYSDPEQTADKPPSEASVFDLGPEVLSCLQDTELDL